jgi:hypothetical protein
LIRKRIQSLAIMGCLLVALTGCSRQWVILGTAAAAVGVGAYAYIKGDLKRTYDVNMDTAWSAAVKAVDDLKLTTESKTHDAFTGNIKGKMADGTSFEINLKRVGENVTEVGVRLGTFGDRPKSEAIHDKILANLKTS